MSLTDIFCFRQNVFASDSTVLYLYRNPFPVSDWLVRELTGRHSVVKTSYNVSTFKNLALRESC